MSDKYRRGDYYVMDDSTGFKIRISEAVRQWDGALVHKDNADPFHPLDMKIRVRPQRSPRVTRPEPQDRFLEANEVTENDL